MSTQKRPVFSDPSGWRALIVRIIFTSTYAFLVFLCGFLGFNVIEDPAFLPLQLPSGRENLAAARDYVGATEPSIDWSRIRTTSNSAGAAKRYAFLVDWDENSFTSLKEHSRDLDVVMPLWLHLKGATGDIRHDDLKKERRILDWLGATSFSTTWQMPAELRAALHRFLPWLRTPQANLSVMPVVDNYDDTTSRWAGEAAATVLSHPALRAKFETELVAYVQGEGLAGIVLDLEALPDSQSANYLALIDELARLLHAKAKKLLVVIPPDDSGIVGIEKLAATAADHLILAAYDEHTDTPGPLASQGWFESVLDAKFANVDGSRIIVGIGSYGEDWSEGKDPEDISATEAWSRLKDSKSTLDFDGNSLNPTFAYSRNGVIHRVWFLDGVTAYNEAAAALAEKPYGIALWCLGAEDPSVWSFFARGARPTEAALKRIETPLPGSSVIYHGKGVVLRVTSQVKRGHREIEFDPASNLITDERLTLYPQPATITRWGARSDKVVALTFDDGPSEKFTPQILDILARKHVKATFFLIGKNAALYPDIVRRIYREGHDIGNHTFTHPNVALLPNRQIELELTATQRVLESEIGVHTTIWRPPYLEDIEPASTEDTAALVESANLGYTTIGQDIDPKDWARPGIDKILRRALAGLDHHEGNVILLHDAGGDREETVKALPRLIDAIRAHGYHFVPIHDLLRIKRTEVMPQIPAKRDLPATVDGIAFSLWRGFLTFLGIFFIVGISLGCARLLVIIVAALFQARRAKRRDPDNWIPQRCAVLVPAFNEAKIICKSIQALLDCRPDNCEIVVIDDGSSDQTAEVARAAFGETEGVTILDKPNGGKASALNYGLSHTDAEFIIAQDADTLFEPGAIPLLLRHFRDPTVGAVAGAVLVGNTVSWIGQFQALEYVTSQNLDRRAMEMANAIAVVPGAIGAWRRVSLITCGGFSDSTLAEDADATVTLERAGWRVLYEPRAVARTEAPETLPNFLKQRFRWMFGMLQVAFKHRGVYAQSEAWGVKLVTLPNIFFFQFLFPLISPAIDLMLLWSLLSVLWLQIMHQSHHLPSNVTTIILYWAGFQALEMAAAIIAILLDCKGNWWHMLPLVIIQRFCYRQLLYVAAIRSTAAALKGGFVSWGKLLRTGNVTPRQARKIGPRCFTWEAGRLAPRQQSSPE